MTPEERAEKLKRIGALPAFDIKDGVLHYHDRSTSSYVPWSDYRSRSPVSCTVGINDFVSDVRKSFPRAMLIPTFRTQDSDSWAGAKAAFEMSFTELNITWFTYIKFYVDRDGISKPLVVGKSGSTLVNATGSNLSFLMNVDDGPARRFLYEECLHWDKIQLLIISCDCEYEAFIVESTLGEMCQ